MLVSPTSLIPRPPARDFDTTNVIKADQLRAWHQRFQEKSTTAAALVGSLLNMRGAATLEEFARKLARQHRPSDPLALPEFMRPRAEVAAAPAAEPRRDPEPAAPPASSAPASVAAPADAGGASQADLRDLRCQDHVRRRQVLLERRAAVWRAAVLQEASGGVSVRWAGGAAG